MTEAPDQPPVDAADDLLQALRLAAEYIEKMSVPSSSIDADVRRMVLARTYAVIDAATREAK